MKKLIMTHISAENIELFVFEIDGAKTEPANEVFLNEVEEADVYIGLIGKHYGDIYLDVVEDNIRGLFGKRNLDKILDYIGAGKIDKNGVFHFNKAGALCFAKDISKFNLEHEVKMVRFNGTERLEIIDKHFTKSSFFKLIKEFDSFFSQNTKLGGIVTGMKRTPIPEYPIKAVREAFINAIAHRDYTLKGNCITFYIYDDRIEIISSGKLPYPMKIEDLGVHKNPIHRNENICKVFQTTEYMEHIGTGIARMRNEMKKSNLPEPEFKTDFTLKYF